jgi:RNA polymerase sigma-70 factor (ECF subfamily)
MARESELIAQSKGGDLQAFSELVCLHQSRVRVFLGRFVFSREAVDDVAQETFLAAFRNLNTFDPDFSFLSWLCGIARNQALIHLRRECQRLRHESRNLEVAMADWSAQKAVQEPSEESLGFLHALEMCLERLPAQSAQVVHAFYYESQGAAEIGKRYGRSDNSIRLWLFRIRRELRKCIKTHFSTQEAGA